MPTKASSSACRTIRCFFGSLVPIPWLELGELAAIRRPVEFGLRDGALSHHGDGRKRTESFAQFTESPCKISASARPKPISVHLGAGDGLTVALECRRARLSASLDGEKPIASSGTSFDRRNNEPTMTDCKTLTSVGLDSSPAVSGVVCGADVYG